MGKWFDTAKRFLLLVCGLLICQPKQVYAAAQNAGRFDEMKKGELPVIIHSKIQDYQKWRNVIICEGYVDIHYGTMRLQADRVELNTETRQIIAEGNAVLDEATNRMTGERMELDLNTKMGIIYQGAGYVESGYYFTGDKIERITEDQYVIDNGTYTSCAPPMPDWQFSAQKCRLHIENYAYLTNFTLDIKKVPVMYSPYGVFPIKSKRTTGFLVPHLGYSNTNGATVKEAFFWAINDWSDATFGVDYFGQRGIGENLEGRYALTSIDNGLLNAYHIRDNIVMRERWQLKMSVNQQLPADVKAVLRLDTFSDRQFDRQLADALVQRTRQKQESYFSFTKNWDGYSLNFLGNYAQDLYQNQQTTVQRLPEVNFNAVYQRLGQTPLFYEWETTASALETRVEQVITIRTERVNLHPRLSLPLTIREGLVLTPSAGIWDTWYSDTPKGGPATRHLYDLKVALDGPQTYRIYDTPDWGNLTRIKHLCYPNITYSYIPYRDQASLFNFDGLDRVGQAYKLDYSLTNNFLGKFKQDDDTSEIRNLLTLTLSQTFDLAEERRMVDLNKRPRRPLSDLKFDAEFKPTPVIRLDYETYYDVYENYFDRVNIDAWLSDPKNIWALTGGWRYTKLTQQQPTRTDSVNAGGSLNLGSWVMKASVNYNLVAKERIEERYDLTYSSQCWGVTFEHVTRPSQDYYGFTINLKGIGSSGP